jgi:hypothetical protein
MKQSKSYTPDDTYIVPSQPQKKTLDQKQTAVAYYRWIQKMQIQMMIVQGWPEAKLKTEQKGSEPIVAFVIVQKFVADVIQVEVLVAGVDF